MAWTAQEQAHACSNELEADEVVYLGPGLPYWVREHLAGRAVIAIDSSGVVGVGPAPRGRTRSVLPAGDGELVTVTPGGAAVGPLRAAAMLRRGWIDVGVIEVGQVDAAGAMTARNDEPAAGELREIARGAGRLIACINHRPADGGSGLQQGLSSPEPGFGPATVALVVSELGVFRPTGSRFELLELASGVDLDDLIQGTPAEIVDRRVAVAEGSGRLPDDDDEAEDDLLASAAPPPD